MKKLFSLFIALLLTLSCTFVAYAGEETDSAGKGQNVAERVRVAEKVKGAEKVRVNERVRIAERISKKRTVEVKEDVNGSIDDVNSIDALRKQLKENRRNKEVRKQIIKKIVELRRQQNDNSIPVIVNGEEVKFDVPPVIKNNRTLIPVRAVLNALGADVQWDRETNTVSITKAVYGETEEPSTIEIKINLNNSSVTVNGEEVTLDVPPQVINNRTMVPIRFIAETFNMVVDWDRNTGAVFIDENEAEENGETAENTEAEDSDNVVGESEGEQADNTGQTVPENTTDSTDSTFEDAQQ